MKSPQSCITVLLCLVLLAGGIYLVAALAFVSIIHAMFPRAQEASKLEINSKSSSSLTSRMADQTSTTSSSSNASDSHAKLSKKAMTWRVLNTAAINGKQYALFGSDRLTNPYQGDSDLNQAHSLLCINKSNLPAPSELPSSSITPGGALRGSWSGGQAVIAPNIQADTLRSQAIADEICRLQGQKETGKDGFRMAEFHDGDQSSGSAGWDFWAEVSSRNSLDNLDNRYWVQINDQGANPW